MRILIVSLFFPPQPSIASLRPFSWAKYWTLWGHEVTVLTTPKCSESGVKLNLKNPGYEILEVPMPGYIESLKGSYQNNDGERGSGPLKKLLRNCYDRLRYRKGIFNACRMPDFSDLWIRPACKKAMQHDPWDLIVTTSGPYAVHFIGRKLKKNGWAKKWIADFRDPWSDNHIYPGLFPFNLAEEMVEKWVVANADILTSVSPAIVSTMSKRHNGHRVHVIENGFDPEDLSGLDPESYFQGEGKFRLVYTGTIYREYQNPRPLFEAIRTLKANPSVRSHLENLEVYFAGPNLDFLGRVLEEYGIGDVVKIAGFVKREDALRMQRDSDALLFFPWTNPVGTGAGVTTGKIFEYLFSGTPILAIGGGEEEESQRIIKRLGAGWTIRGAEELSSFLMDRMLHPKEMKHKIDFQKLSCFTREDLSRKMLELAL